MQYHPSPLALPLLFLMLAPVWIIIFLQRPAFGRLISRYVDRYNIRPSVIDGIGALLTGLPSMLFIFIYPAPSPFLHITCCLFGPFALAIAAEMIRTPAAEQTRPNWYVGQGKPEWRPPKLLWKQRFSIFSAVVFLTALCVAVAIVAPRWKAQKLAESNRTAAIKTILDLGGKVIQPRTVILAGTKATDKDLGVLIHLDRLEELNLGGTDISNNGLKHIAKAPGIRTLILSGTQVNDAGLTEIRNLKNLGTLQLRQTNVTGEGLREDWTELKQLDLSRCPITREGLERAALYPSLVYLSLQETDVDDSMIDVLAKLNTQVLDIIHTRITDEGFEKLKSMATGITTVRREQRPRPTAPALP